MSRLTVKGRTTTVNQYIQRHFKKNREQAIAINGSHYRVKTTLCHLAGIGTVRVVFSQKKGRTGILPLFSTDPTMTTKDILTIYRVRWSIEVLFKETKQYLGLTAYHHRDEKAVRTHLQLVLIAHALLIHLFLSEQREKGKHLTKKLLATFSIREYKERIRTLVASDVINYVKELSELPDNTIFNKIQLLLLAA